MTKDNKPAKADSACPSCKGTGQSTMQESKFPKPFPAWDRKHLQTPIKDIPCPPCRGSGKKN